MGCGGVTRQKILTEGRYQAAAKLKKQQDGQITNFYQNIIKSLHEEISHLKDEITLLRSQNEKTTTPQCSTGDEIVDDLILHLSDKEAEYNYKTICLALEINSTSAKAYKLLAEALSFPSSSIIEKKLEATISGFPSQLTQTKNINDVVNTYKRKHSIPLSEKKLTRV